MKPKYASLVWLALAVFALGAAAQTTVTNSNNGTANTVPVYTGTATLGNSPIAVSGSNVGIGTTAPAYLLSLMNSGGAAALLGYDTTTANGIQTFGKTPLMQLTGNGINNYGPGLALLQLNINNTTTTPNQSAAEFYLGATNGTTASARSAVANSAILGQIGFYGDDGTDLRTRGALIQASIDTTHGAVGRQSLPTRLAFATEANGPITFHTNVGTWLYGPATGSGTMTVNERMRIDYNGNVGIGTAAPGALLHLSGPSTFSAQTPQFKIADTASLMTLNIGVGTDGTNKVTWLQSTENTVSNNRNLAFQPYGGNVGIGTTSPAYKLDVAAGQMNSSGGYCIAGSCITSWPTASSNTWTGAQTFNGTTNFPAGTWSSNGNVGIGTTTPSLKLDVVGTAGYPANSGTIDNGAARFEVSGASTTVLDVGQGNTGAYPMWLQSVYSNNLALTAPLLLNPNGGNVGIGTTSPSAALQVNGGFSKFQFNTQTWPATDGAGGLVVGWNRSGGAAETNFYNVYSNAGTAFQFTQMTGTNTGINLMTMLGNGNVGIGTANPQAMLEINGNLRFTADGSVQTTAWTGVLCGGDYAESVDVTGDRKHYEPGDVLVLDADNPGKMLKSIEAYSTSVSGIYSTKPGTVGRRQTTAKSPDEVPMAVVGIVPAKVSAENGPVKVGDLLVTSSTPGYAMKGTDSSRMLGAVVGKAMAKLDSGTGVIEVLVTLQ